MIDQEAEAGTLLLTVSGERSVERVAEPVHGDADHDEAHPGRGEVAGDKGEARDQGSGEADRREMQGRHAGRDARQDPPDQPLFGSGQKTPVVTTRILLCGH